MTGKPFNFAFSYSRWSLWERCPAAFKYKHIDKLPEPASPAMERGRKIHKEAEDFINGKVVDLPESLARFKTLAEGLRDVPAGLVKVESQMAFDRDQRPVSWFGANAYWRFIWDVGVRDPDRNHFDAVDWKGLALDTPLPCPGGWDRMDAVEVGDFVFAPDGTPTKVMGKSEVKHLRCFEVSFDTNCPPIVCDEEHLWEVVRGKNSKPLTLPVTDLRPLDRIALPGPVQREAQETGLVPYVLGCWLGDGHKRDGTISKPDAELFDHIEACGYKVHPVQPSSNCGGRTVSGLRGELAGYGLLNNKHIPAPFFGTAVEQRQELLRGIMDTGGTWNKTRRRAVLTTVDRAFAVQVQSLAASLGERATLHTYETSGFGKRVTAYNVDWTPTRFNPFKLSRKADLVQGRVGNPQRTVSVREVREVPSVPTQCIEVDHPSRMYLAGLGHIPTHNTGKPYGSYDAQMQIFALPAFWTVPDLQTFTGHLIYLDNGDAVSVTYNRAQMFGPTCDPAANDGLQGLWRSNVAMMEADQAYRPKPSRDACRFCHFSAKKGGPCQEGVS
jgi:hypothetical protein